ncbi:MAG: hypothetical protein WBX19_07430, partial [Terracidiphilus sp.]
LTTRRNFQLATGRIRGMAALLTPSIAGLELSDQIISLIRTLEFDIVSAECPLEVSFQIPGVRAIS